jgi:hypothetical protein
MVETLKPAEEFNGAAIDKAEVEAVASAVARLGDTEKVEQEALRVFHKFDSAIAGETNDVAFIAVKVLLHTLMEQMKAPPRVN